MERARFLNRRSARAGGAFRAVATLAMLAAGFGLSAGAAGAAPRASLTAMLSFVSIPAGQAVSLDGRLKSAKSRAVYLQEWSGKAWKTVGKTTAAKKTGLFSISVPTATPGRFVLRASTTKSHGITPVSAASTLVVTAIPPPCCAATSTPTPTPTPTPKASFRAVYALAHGQASVPGKRAAIANDIAAVNGWFATQTNQHVQPRWARDSSGAVAITTVRLPDAPATYQTKRFEDLVDQIEAQNPPLENEKTVVWLNVKSPYGCAVTGLNVSMVYEAACDLHPATTDVWPHGATYVTAHEMTHNFGAVSPCAPHSGKGGHVIDDPRDVLYAGPSTPDWAHVMLDPGHDDYYDTGRAACPGIENSPYWTTTSDPLS